MEKQARCQRCRLRADLCVCPLIPSIATTTRVVLLMHVQEIPKPTNTGRLAHLSLPNSELRLRGVPGEPLSLEGLLDPPYETWMLRLSPASEEVTAAVAAKDPARPVRLLVLDGNWSQASRLGAKLAKELPGVKQVKLQATKPSEYRLRNEHHPDGMATFEAIARALAVLEGERGPAIEAQLEKLFQTMTDRVLWARGKLRAEDVRGGLPGLALKGKTS